MFRYTLIFTIIAFSLSAQTKQKVDGIYTESNSYCSGARPSQEMLNDLEKPVPLANKVLYIKSGTENNLKKKRYVKVKTDLNGTFTCSLPIGQYIIIGVDKLDLKYYNFLLSKYAVPSKNYKAVDKACLNEWLKEPLLSFEVKKNKTDTLKIHLTKPCEWNSIPCTQFTGPLPP
jgi:hypothetical protein